MKDSYQCSNAFIRSDRAPDVFVCGRLDGNDWLTCIGAATESNSRTKSSYKTKVYENQSTQLNHLPALTQRNRRTLTNIAC